MREGELKLAAVVTAMTLGLSTIVVISYARGWFSASGLFPLAATVVAVVVATVATEYWVLRRVAPATEGAEVKQPGQPRIESEQWATGANARITVIQPALALATLSLVLTCAVRLGDPSYRNVSDGTTGLTSSPVGHNIVSTTIIRNA